MNQSDNMMEHKCSKCGKISEYQIYKSVNAVSDPQLRLKVLDGSLLRCTCPSCGAVGYLRYPVLYHDPAGKFMIWLYPEDELDPAVMEYGIKVSDMLPGYQCRRVENMLRLAEKIQIFEQGASDVAVELSKLIFRHEMAAKYKDMPEKVAEIYDSNIFCHGFRMENGVCAEFTVSVVDASGNFAYFSVAPHIYSDSLGIVERNSQLRPQKGFATIDSEWIQTIIG